MGSFKFSFLGDISFNDEYINLSETNAEPFTDLQPYLTSDREIVGNLECMARGEFGENELRTARLSTTQETLRKYLSELNLTVACLAHNHVYDHLLDGFKKTKEVLTELGIESFGAGTNKEEAVSPLILIQDDISVGILNYVTEDTHPNLPENAPVYVNYFNEEKAFSDIRKLKNKVDQVVISLHWGGRVENGFYPDKVQPGIAHGLIDAGADLIIGHHSHTLQPYEVYKEKLIFYSLGNFCFSDVKLDEKIIEIRKGRNTQSVIVNVDFSSDSYSFDLIPIENYNGKISLNAKVLNRLKIRNWIYNNFGNNRLFFFVYKIRLRYINPVLFFLTSSKIGIIDKIRNLNPVKVVRFLKSR